MKKSKMLGTVYVWKHVYFGEGCFQADGSKFLSSVSGQVPLSWKCHTQLIDCLQTFWASRQWALMGPPLNWDILRTKTYLPEESPFMSIRVTNPYLYSVSNLVKPQKRTMRFQTPKFGKIIQKLDTVCKGLPNKI